MVGPRSERHDPASLRRANVATTIEVIMHLRFVEDRRTLLYAFVLFPLVPTLSLTFPWLTPWLVPLALYGSYLSGVLAHNHNHRFIWNQRKVEKAILRCIINIFSYKCIFFISKGICAYFSYKDKITLLISKCISNFEKRDKSFPFTQ
jgi:hypothetical protein